MGLRSVGETGAKPGLNSGSPGFFLTEPYLGKVMFLTHQVKSITKFVRPEEELSNPRGPI